MADLTQDAYNEANLFSKVVFQKDRDVVDYELNEFQDILRVFLFRMMRAGVQSAYNGITLDPGSNDDGYKVVGTGAAAVSLQVGTLFIGGIPLRLTSVLSYTPTAYAGSARTDVIYLSITENEVADPAQFAQLGETSRRRQIQIQINTSITGLGGVPGNSGGEIWQGGIKYYPIASITRTASNIAANQVTDLRKLLPPSLMANITRQINNYAVAAIKAGIIETPPGGVGEQPLGNTLYLDLDPANSVSLPGDLVVRHGRDAGGAMRVLARVRRGAIATGVEGAILAEATTAVGSSSGPLKLIDPNVTAGAATGGPYVPFSESGNGANLLRRNEAGTGSSSTPGVSILRAVNARWTVTIGDGVNSFGDYNGVDALIQVLHDAQVAGVQNLHVQVKSGAFNTSLPSSGWVNPTFLELIIEGYTRTSSILQLTSTATYEGGIFSTFANVINLVLKNLTVSNGVTNIHTILNMQNNGSLRITSCNLSYVTCQLYDINSFIFEDLVWTTPGDGFNPTQPIVGVYWGTIGGKDYVGPFVVRDCRIEGKSFGPIFNFGTNTSYTDVRKILFVNSVFVTKNSDYISNDFGHDNGVLKFNDYLQVTYHDIEFRDCQFLALISNTETAIWFNIRVANVPLIKLSFIGCAFRIYEGVSEVQCSPFVVTNAGWAQASTIKAVVFEECTVDRVRALNGAPHVFDSAHTRHWGWITCTAVNVRIKDLVYKNATDGQFVFHLFCMFNKNIAIDGLTILETSSSPSNVNEAYGSVVLIPAIATVGDELRVARRMRVSTVGQSGVYVRPGKQFRIEDSNLKTMLRLGHEIPVLITSGMGGSTTYNSNIIPIVSSDDQLGGLDVAGSVIDGVDISHFNTGSEPNYSVNVSVTNCRILSISLQSNHYVYNAEISRNYSIENSPITVNFSGTAGGSLEFIGNRLQVPSGVGVGIEVGGGATSGSSIPINNVRFVAQGNIVPDGRYVVRFTGFTTALPASSSSYIGKLVGFETGLTGTTAAYTDGGQMIHNVGKLATT